MIKPVPERTYHHLLIGTISVAFLMLTLSALAQAPPRGSYRQSCRDISISGTALQATCQTESGDWQTTSFPNPADCPGDMANLNGALRCIVFSGGDFDLVTFVVENKTKDSETKLWKVDRPYVKKPLTEYRMIRFQPGDRIAIFAGGCVQTGGSGKTWKSYVTPSGANHEQFYSGTVMIPTLIGSPQRIAGVLSPKQFQVGANLAPGLSEEMFLRLGYQDEADQYDDNGYYDHDDGTEDQCKGVGSAWVKIRIVSRLGTPPPEDGTKWSPYSKPFDLVWDINNQDRNGLPLNPIWAAQIMHLEAKTDLMKPDFAETCGPAFTGPEDIDEAKLATICTSQAPTADFYDASVWDLPSPLKPVTYGTYFCPAQPLRGHLNWSFATFVGKVGWGEYSGTGPGPFWDSDFTLHLSGVPSGDTDYGPNILAPVNAAFTKATAYLSLEVAADESIDNFHSPWWVNFREAGENNDDAARNILKDKYAVVTGLIGIDAVHDGGESESHPVYSLAVRTARKVEKDSIDETWAFFLRNTGGEGSCSQLEHDWLGLEEKYYISLPWPKGATSVSIVPGAAQAWTYEQAGVTALQPETDSVWTYVGFRLPDPSQLPAVDGEITLHYTVRPDIVQHPGSGQNIYFPYFPGLGGVSKPHSEEEADWRALAMRIDDPAARRRFVERLRAMPPIGVSPRPHNVRLAIDQAIAVHKPVIGLANKGMPTRDRQRLDPARQKARHDQVKAVLAIIQNEGTEPGQPPRH
jgi:hypothetical protein